MSNSADLPENDLHIQMMLTEPRIAAITLETLGDARDGFPLTPTRDMAWLVRAIQGAISVTLKHIEDGPDRQDGKEVFKEMIVTAERVRECFEALLALKRSPAGNDALWHLAWFQWDGAGDQISEPPAMKYLNQTVEGMGWLADFLSAAAERVTLPPHHKWRQSEEREEKIFWAECLAIVYEKAFAGKKAGLNRWEGAKSLGPWADFYERIIGMAFPKDEIKDLEGVLKEAGRRHRENRVKLEPGIIPE